ADLVEALDRVGKRHRRTGNLSELLSGVGVLRQELLDATSTVDDELVLFAEFVDAEDGDDVLQLLVLLQNRLDLVGHTVVLVTDDQRLEDARGRGQRVDGRVQTARSDVAAELCGRVQVGEGRRRGRVRVVIGGNVDRLHRRDRVTTRRGDAFLQQTHLVSQIGLVAHGRGHATQQGR